MKRYLAVIIVLTLAVAAYAKDIRQVMGGKPTATVTPSAKSYIMASISTATGWDLRRMAEDSVPRFGGIDTTAPDGQRRLNVRNTVARTYPPQEGDLDTDANGKLWLYTSGQYVEYSAGEAPVPVSLASIIDWPAGIDAGKLSTLANVTGDIQGQFDALNTQIANLVAAMEAAGIDTTPDAFSFTDQTGVAASTEITSASITVAGITNPTVVTVAGGSYDINSSGNFVTTQGTVTNGQTVRARHTSASAGLTDTSTTVTIGGVSDTFTSTTFGYADKDFYLTNTGTESIGTTTNTARVGSSFTVGGDYHLTQISVPLQAVLSPVGTLTAYIYTDNSNIPGTGTASTNTIAANTVLKDTTGNTWYTFDFAPYQVYGGQKYWIVLRTDTVDAANYIKIFTAATTSDFKTVRSADGATWMTRQASFRYPFKTRGY